MNTMVFHFTVEHAVLTGFSVIKQVVTRFMALIYSTTATAKCCHCRLSATTQLNRVTLPRVVLTYVHAGVYHGLPN